MSRLNALIRKLELYDFDEINPTNLLHVNRNIIIIHKDSSWTIDNSGMPLLERLRNKGIKYHD